MERKSKIASKGHGSPLSHLGSSVASNSKRHIVSHLATFALIFADRFRTFLPKFGHWMRGGWRGSWPMQCVTSPQFRFHLRALNKGRDASTPRAERLRVPLAPLSMTLAVLVIHDACEKPICHAERSSEVSKSEPHCAVEASLPSSRSIHGCHTAIN